MLDRPADSLEYLHTGSSGIRPCLFPDIAHIAESISALALIPWLDEREMNDPEIALKGKPEISLAPQNGEIRAKLRRELQPTPFVDFVEPALLGLDNLILDSVPHEEVHEAVELHGIRSKEKRLRS